MSDEDQLSFGTSEESREHSRSPSVPRHRCAVRLENKNLCVLLLETLVPASHHLGTELWSKLLGWSTARTGPLYTNSSGTKTV